MISTVRNFALAAALLTAFAAPAATLLSATAIPGAPPGARAYAIRYTSTDYNGRPDAVTGLLIEPKDPAPAGGRPIVAWAHGTTGIGEACAPSGAPTRFSQIPGLADMLDRGWVVVAADYAGLGSPGPHPYLVKDATALAVLDSVRAARAHASARAGTSFALWGLSQGGHAALVSAERARAYVPELTLVGTAAAAPPTDLQSNFAAGGKPTTRGVLIAFASSSWSQVYGAPLATLGPPATVRLIDRLSRICVLGHGPKLGTMLGAVALGHRLRGVDVAHLDPWMGLLQRNSADPRAASAAPLLIAQSPRDEVVSAPITRTYARAACTAGARLRWVAVDSEHAATAKHAERATVDWLADRFAGRSAPSDCAAEFEGGPNTKTL